MDTERFARAHAAVLNAQGTPAPGTIGTLGEKTLHAVFNFSDEDRTLWMPERADYTDLVSGKRTELETFDLAAWDFRWWLR